MSYFLIEKPSGGKKFILNLKKLNKYIEVPHFKLKDLKFVCQLLSPGSYMVTVDLEDDSSRKFLHFPFCNTLFEFTALSFSLSIAPFVFTKLMKSVAAYLRKKGYVSIIYLDDFLLIGDSFEDCKVNVDVTLSLLMKLVFRITHKKSELTPSTR